MPEVDPYAPTELLPAPRVVEPLAAAAPVFVDVSGRRRRVAHRVALAVFLAASGYALMVIWSLLGGPVSPDTLMPFSAPHPAASIAATVRPSATADARARVSSSSSSPQATRGAAGAVTSAASSPTRTPVAGASPSASAAASGHRPTTTPGKPSATTTGHGH